MHTLHLGDLLVKHGVLSAAQRDAVLEAQRVRGGPFGAIAEQMFGVNPTLVEQAWAEQYASMAPHMDPRAYPVSARTLEIISKRQAWQFRLLPLEMTGRELLACTTQEALPRALKFAGWRLGHGVRFVIADPKALGEALEKHYPMAGMSADMMLEPV
ncbi:MAG: hypothetical protein HBSAPP03_09890 [Phycisphaerae bacterium]|nr:MAG: hypothetical protein HBSAPP03_09890 [Phycisphaerae bacterium]